jgi:hypothetical protein
MAIAKSLSFYANGVDIANALTSFTLEAGVEEIDNTTLSLSSRTYEQGFKSGGINGSGVFKYDQTNADEIHNVMSAAYTNASTMVITTGPSTLAVGGLAILADCQNQGYSIQMPLGQLITVQTNLRANNGLGFGKWLFNAAVDNTSTNGTSIDNAASTANGGVFHAHIQNPSGLAGNIKVQHSTDNSVWVDLATLTLTGGGTLLEGLSTTVAAGTTVNRYIRARATATSGSITFQAAFSRS